MKNSTFRDTVSEWVSTVKAWAKEHPYAFWSSVGAGGLIVLPLFILFLLPYILMPFAPEIDTSQDLYALNRPVAFTFLDANGDVAGRRGALVGERLKLEEMPDYLPAAFIAMEDRRFYRHDGIDPVGMLRAFLIDIRARRVVAGGSTISQQTAKIVFTNSERSFSRKLSDMLGALALEKALTKKQILELYLNRLYLGSGAYGIDGASHVYFGKSAKQLTLSEAAMLATLTTAPSVFSPRRDLKRAQERAARVLAVMVDQGAITQAQADKAIARPAVISNPAVADAKNYYFDQAAQEALAKATVNGQRPTGDLVVRTMFVPQIQEAAVKSAQSIINGPKGLKARVREAAVLVMKPDGGVAALLGGVDYTESSFNRATQAHRQPGSSFKPFIYLAALEAGMTPSDVREDQPVTIDGWSPTNFGGHNYGTLTLTDALTHSVNTVAVEVAQEVGIDKVVGAAKRCGIESPLRHHPSLALGTSEVTLLELTQAYATIAAGGLRAHPYFVTEVKTSSGKVLYRRQSAPEERVIASSVVRDLTAMMYSVVTNGTGGNAGIWTHEAAGKTGTTQDYHDAWFVGFTADYVAGVWVGNDDSSPMNNVTGGTLPAEIWKATMREAEKGLPAKPLDRSSPFVQIDEDLMSSGLPEGEDDESSAPLTQPPTQAAAPQTAAPTAAQPTQERKGFFGRLFGGPNAKQTAQPTKTDEGN